MHSDDETPTQNDISDTKSPPPLRREVPVTDRQRISLVAGALSLAGVALGFGLGHVSSANSNCPRTVVVQAHHATVDQQPIQASMNPRLTWLGAHVESGPTMPTGATVTDVFPGSPAAVAGLEPGHRIIGFGLEPVHTASALTRQVRLHEPGDKVSLRVLNTLGSTLDLPVTLDSISPSEYRHAIWVAATRFSPRDK